VPLCLADRGRPPFKDSCGLLSALAGLHRAGLAHVIGFAPLLSPSSARGKSGQQSIQTRAVGADTACQGYARSLRTGLCIDGGYPYPAHFAEGYASKMTSLIQKISAAADTAIKALLPSQQLRAALRLLLLMVYINVKILLIFGLLTNKVGNFVYAGF
jgi:hypothetical protein